MNVAEELKKGNLRSIKIWLMHLRADNLIDAYGQVAGLQDIELFRLAEARLVAESIRSIGSGSHWLDKEFRASTPVPEIAYGLYTRTGIWPVQFRRTSGVKEEVHQHPGVLVSYRAELSYATNEITIAGVNPARLFRYLKKTWPNPWTKKIFKALLAGMGSEINPGAWDNDLREAGLLAEWSTWYKEGMDGRR